MADVGLQDGREQLVAAELTDAEGSGLPRPNRSRWNRMRKAERDRGERKALYGMSG
jgi:hypothetical protein